MQKRLFDLIKSIRVFLSQALERYDSKLPYIITTIISLALVIGGIKIFIALTERLKDTYLETVDSQVSDYIQSYRNPILTDYFVFVTELGDALGYVIIFTLCTILFYWLFKSWKYVGKLALVLVLALSSNLILKQLINRARPDVEHLVTVQTLSYPSGHAMMAMAFYGLLIYLVHEFRIRKLYKILLTILFSVLILSIGISRIYLGVHYPSDIAGGFIAGFIWVVFCVMIFNLIQLFQRDENT